MRLIETVALIAGPPRHIKRGAAVQRHGPAVPAPTSKQCWPVPIAYLSLLLVQKFQVAIQLYGESEQRFNLGRR